MYKSTKSALNHKPILTASLVVIWINADSLIDLAFVSVALWSAVEAYSVHRNMGHLLRGNLHLEHRKRRDKRKTMRQGKEKENWTVRGHT